MGRLGRKRPTEHSMCEDGRELEREEAERQGAEALRHHLSHVQLCLWCLRGSSWSHSSQRCSMQPRVKQSGILSWAVGGLACSRHWHPTAMRRGAEARFFTGTPFRDEPARFRVSMLSQSPRVRGKVESLKAGDGAAQREQMESGRHKKLQCRSPRWPRLSWQLLTSCPLQRCRAS